MMNYVIHLFGFSISIPPDWFIDSRKHGMAGMRKFFRKDSISKENYLKTSRCRRRNK